MNHTYTAANGINLNRSIHDPSSALVQVLYHLYCEKTAVSKRGIMEDVFGKEIADPSVREYQHPKVRVSGWRGQFFAAMKKNGYVGTMKHGNVTYYFITDTGKRILERLGMV